MAINNLGTGLRPGVCTSLSRPTTPYEGQVIFETDTDKALVWNGSAWLFLSTPQASEIGAWQTWTPVVTQSVNVTVTNNTARYTQINKLVVAQTYLTVTGAGTTNNPVFVSLPITLQANSNHIIATGFIYDSSAATLYTVVGVTHSATQAAFYYQNPSGQLWGQAPNIGLASTDQLRLLFVYEAA